MRALPPDFPAAIFVVVHFPCLGYQRAPRLFVEGGHGRHHRHGRIDRRSAPGACRRLGCKSRLLTHLPPSRKGTRCPQKGRWRVRAQLGGPSPAGRPASAPSGQPTSKAHKVNILRLDYRRGRERRGGNRTFVTAARFMGKHIPRGANVARVYPLRPFRRVAGRSATSTAHRRDAGRQRNMAAGARPKGL